MMWTAPSPARECAGDGLRMPIRDGLQFLGWGKHADLGYASGKAFRRRLRPCLSVLTRKYEMNLPLAMRCLVHEPF
jgi:hypothetical protein